MWQQKAGFCSAQAVALEPVALLAVGSTSEEGKDALQSPQCVAVDAQDNIYVTDSETGKILVWDANLKYRRAIGSSCPGIRKHWIGASIGSTSI